MQHVYFLDSLFPTDSLLSGTHGQSEPRQGWQGALQAVTLQGDFQQL